ncbi:MAG: sugar phosphate isomerase/epimerase family protein [bacterium]|jgi:sugar phosphate isomerase/epimerase
MGNIEIGVNMEFVRHHDKPFAEGVKIAADIGYKYVEPMVHLGRELLSEAGYFHSYSMDDDPLYMKEICDRYGVKISGLSAHCPLARPEISVNYLTRAIRFASDVGAPIVNTDEGIVPDWMSEQQAFAVMEYTLTMVCKTAERYGIYIGIEDHQIYSRTPEGLLRIASLVDSPYLQINYDSGNAYVSGSDPDEMLEKVKHKVYHYHAKDIGGVQLEQRGKVTGVPVGVACGEGVINWERQIEILKTIDRDIVLSVECGTIEQAEKSFAYLSRLVG